MATKKDVEEIKVPEGQEETKAEVTPIEGESTGAENKKEMSTGKKVGIIGTIVIVVAGLIFGGKKFFG